MNPREMRNFAKMLALDIDRILEEHSRGFDGWFQRPRVERIERMEVIYETNRAYGPVWRVTVCPVLDQEGHVLSEIVRRLKLVAYNVPEIEFRFKEA